MGLISTRLIITTLVTLFGFILTRAPFLMTSVAPSKPWADGPLRLITTPQFQTKKVPALK